MKKNGSALVVISARGGSKGVPGKNLKSLNGRPLISYAIKAALKARLVNEVIVSTEDDKIASIAKDCGAKVPFKRPAELADDKTPLVSVAKHGMKAMDELGSRADIIVQLSPTCPFITGGIIDKTIEKIFDADSVVTLKRIEHEHPYRAKELFEGDRLRSFIKDVDVEKFQSRQDLPVLYCTSGAVYTRRRHLLENASGRDFAFGEVAKAVILSDIEAINIDRPIDFVLAEFIMKSYSELQKRGLI